MNQAELRAELTALRSEVSSLRSEKNDVAALRSELAAIRAKMRSDAQTSPPVPEPAAPNRRQLLRLAAAGAGGLGLAQVVAASPAAAGNGQAVILGSDTNTATEATGVSVKGFFVPYGLGATDDGSSAIPVAAGVFGHAKGETFHAGVVGMAEGDAFYGVHGYAVRGHGVYGTTNSPSGYNDSGVRGVGFYGTGVSALGRNCGVRGDVYDVDAPALQAGGVLALDGLQALPPTAGTYRRGDISNDKDGSGVWVCVTAGTPGVWRKLAGAATAGAFHPIDGKRAYDSRTTGGRLNAGQTRTVTVPIAAAPSGSTAISYVLTAVTTAGTGTLVAHQANRTRPGITSLAWSVAGQQLSVGLVTGLSPLRQLKVYASAGSTHFTIDVLGYFR